MACLVYITNGMASTLNSSLELSRRLTKAGHEIIYLSHADIEQKVISNGYKFYKLTKVREYKLVKKNHYSWSPELLKAPGQLLNWLRECRKLRHESIENDEVESLVTHLNPDLLIIDIEMHFAVIATAHLNIPTVLCIVWFSIFRQSGLPPMHTNINPGNGLVNRLTINIAWRHLRLSTALSEWKRRLSRKGLMSQFSPITYGTVNFDDLKALGRSRNYDFKVEINRSHWLRPFTYCRLPILCFNAWEMELPHVSHPNLHYVGPMVYRQGSEVQVDTVSNRRWNSLLQSRQAEQNKSKPLVYCSLGSFWKPDYNFLCKVIEVFERRSDWDLVIGLGDKLEGTHLKLTPPNVTILDWAPQTQVLQYADCAVTHGGITSINECISLHVPLVVYSTKHIDQNGCATRVNYHGLGLAGDKDTDTPEQIETKIARVLSEPVFLDNVIAMHKHFIRYEQAHTAVRAIECVLRREEQSPGSIIRRQT